MIAPFLDFALPFLEELIVRRRRQPLQCAALIDELACRLHVAADLLPQLLVRRLRLDDLLAGKCPLDAVSARPAAQPEFGGAEADLMIVIAHEAADERERLVAGLLEAPLLRSMIEFLPLRAIAARPLLAGLRFALHLLTDEVPGIPAGAQLRGDGQQGGCVVTHDANSSRERCCGNGKQEVGRVACDELPR